MPDRWGLGPVFDCEMRIGARRWQVYAGRAAFVAALLAGMVTIWWMYLDVSWSGGIRNQAKVGQAYFYALIGVQLALTMIAAPAATAGAVCVERSRGSLAHMLVTDLSDPEIILGKLAARLLPIFAMIFCAWPVAALGSLLGGIDPDNLTMAFAITLAVGLVGCSLALVLSVWTKTVHEVLMAVYTFWAVVLLGYPVTYMLSFSLGKSVSQQWFLIADPFWLAFAPYLVPGRYGFWEYGGFFAGAIGLSAVFVVIAVVGVRVNPIGEAKPKRRGRLAAAFRRIGRWTRWLPAPSLDVNPVFWREWHRNGSAGWLRFLATILVLASTAACFQGAFEIYTGGVQIRGGLTGILAAMAQTLFGLLILSVFASLSLSEERGRGSLDVLLASPLSTRSIVWGKWLGAFRIVPLLAIGPGVICASCAAVNISPFVAAQPAMSRFYYNHLALEDRVFGAALMPLTILAHGALITSVGLALATWIRRQSRAISLCVVTCVATAVVLPILIIILAGPGGSGLFGWTAWLLASSPVFVVIQLTECLTSRPIGAVGLMGWIRFWDVAALSAAIVLLEATVRTFDRCFDRMPEARSLIQSRRRRNWRPPTLEILAADPALVTNSGSRTP